MKKQIVYLLIPFMLGCNFLFPQIEQEAAAPPTQLASDPVQQIEPTPEMNTEIPQENFASAFTITRVHTRDGELYTQLAAEVQKAKILNQIPILEFDAVWCPPCIAIEESLKAKDPITINAYTGVYIIRADVDEWGWGDKDKFKFNGIPVYYKLDENGNPTGAVIDGGAWGNNTPENFAPVLNIFFHTQ